MVNIFCVYNSQQHRAYAILPIAPGTKKPGQFARAAWHDYAGVPVGTIKRHATSKGNAPKAAMIAAARARGFSPADDNEADAIALLLWAIETNGGVA
ncbi:hypothetical protein [uncultured Paracoccus sp.]|uniref:hypothetical protein n=1 Tax=uncultured Paracoccus sp. TaxID=189685 RepID=UPI002612567B|nr:hypothetical protein [uncultured Paracoccus sp.]